MNSIDINSFSSKRKDAESAKHKRVSCGDKNKFKCACGKVYDHETSLASHIGYKTISYTCPHCSKVINTAVGLKWHLDHKICRKDDDEDNEDDEDDELILGSDYEDAVIHKRVKHSDEDKFKCACGRVYQNEKKFLHHLRYGTLTFPCANCGCKEFTTQRSLDEHLLSYKCKGTASGRADENNVNDYEPPVTVSNANSSSSSSSRNIQSSATSASASASASSSSKGG